MSSLYRAGSTAFSLSSLPTNSASRRVMSVSGTRNVKMSYPSGSFGSSFDLSGYGGGSGNALTGQEKVTMQNLNDRLASYLEKVRSLESANAKLEQQIREWYQKQTPTLTDYSKFEAIVDQLRKKISTATQDNARMMLQIDNARLAAEDFRIKFENEMAARMSVEGDIAGLRKVLDEFTSTRSELEMQVEGLKEELVYLKKNHADELAVLCNQVSASSVNVEVDAKPQADMAAVLTDIRSQYETIADKNRRDMESWYQAKFDDLNKQMASSTESLQTSRTVINELKRTLQALQIDLQSQISLKAALEDQLRDTESSYSRQLTQLQAMINGLESELSAMRADIDRQAKDYQMLLDIKTRLELEIAEYRRLLDGEDSKRVVTVTEVKPPPLVKTQRRTVVIEEIVNGKVVSRTEDLEQEVLKDQ